MPKPRSSESPKPPSWSEWKDWIGNRWWWLSPLARAEWASEWVYYGLRRLALFDLLELAGKLTIVVAIVVWFLEADQRAKQAEEAIKERHYRAWDVINSARGSTSDGGRIAALQDLNNDRVSLAAAPLKQAYLPGVNLEGANLEGADLEGADLTGANLQSANLKKAKLHDVNLFGANLQHAKLGGSISRELHKSNLSLKTEESGSGIAANLSGADLQGADFTEANLERADLTGANLESAVLTGANLLGAHLTDANLSGANLQGADLTEANLQGADFTFAELRGTDLTEANLRGADNLQHVKMTYRSKKALHIPPFNAPRLNANITQEQLNAANGDDETVLPDGLSRPAHWSKTKPNESPPPAQPDAAGNPPAAAGAPEPGK